MAEKFNVKEWSIVGVVLGLLTPIILWFAGKLPMLQLTFSTISLNIRDSVTQNLISNDVAEWIQGYLGISLTLPGIIFGMVSGVVLVLLARFIVSKVKFLEVKDKLVRLMIVVFIALLLQMIILAGFGVPTFSAIFGFVIAAVAVSLIVAKVVYPMIMKKKLPE